jgi:hypothetical protein
VSPPATLAFVMRACLQGEADSALDVMWRKKAADGSAQ